MLANPLRTTRNSNNESVTCIFCQRISTSPLLAENSGAVAFPDAYPLTSGHTLVVPRRHEADFFALSPGERSEVFELIADVKRRLDALHSPNGYNIGVNVGEAAGQTIPHAHLHVIPRYAGDVADPRGGIRWVLPKKAAYWR